VQFGNPETGFTDMQIHLDTGDKDEYFIRAYEPGRIRINQESYSSSLIVSPRALHPDWPVSHPDQLRREHLHSILELKPELVLIGTGARLQFPPASILQDLVASAIGYEVMDTAAACRTYNVLMSERRLVVAGLILPPDDA
jgi:uncharacterized protein